MKVIDTVNRLASWAGRRHGPQGLQRSMKALQGWADSPLGQAILAEQRVQLDEVLGPLFGYHLLELNSLKTEPLSESSRISHRFRLAPLDGFKGGALANYEQLPLPDESIDVVLLHHVLEFSPDPHQLLREANRVLIARGSVVIVGFNPWSLQGLYKFFAQHLGRGLFWRRHGLSSGRLADWLRLLDCEPISLLRGFYRLPINQAGLLNRLHFWEHLCQRLRLPFGGYYILLAQKDRVALLPTKPQWSAFKPVAGLVMGKPSTRMPEPARREVCNKGGSQSGSH